MKEMKSGRCSKCSGKECSCKNGHSKRKIPSTSKVVLFSLIVLCIEIVLFCEWAMITLNDASSLYVLIGIPAALSPVIWGYYSKSKAENTNGGIVFEAAMERLRAGEENRENPVDSDVESPSD